jgi:hypothetical protein
MPEHAWSGIWHPAWPTRSRGAGPRRGQRTNGDESRLCRGPGGGGWPRAWWGWVWWRWRDRLDPGCFVRPDQQDRAGGVVNDEAGHRAQACWAEAGTVAVAGCHQQVGGPGGLDDDTLDPAGPCLAPGLAPKPRRGGGQQLGGGLFRQHADPLGRVPARSWAATPEQPGQGASGGFRDLARGDVQQGDRSVGGQQRAGGIHAALPGALDQPDQHAHRLGGHGRHGNARSTTHSAAVAAPSAAGTVSAPSRRNSETAGSASRSRSTRRHSSVASEPT